MICLVLSQFSNAPGPLMSSWSQSISSRIVSLCLAGFFFCQVGEYLRKLSSSGESRMEELDYESIISKKINQSTVKFEITFYYSYFYYFHLSMEKGLTLKVSARLQENCEGLVEIVDANQLILINKGANDYKQFQVDSIHSSKDSNDKVFEDVIRVPSNQLFEGHSSMMFFLGGPQSGKTFTVAGKMHSTNERFKQPGILTYLMRRLFSKYKYQVPIHSTFSFWCKFLEVRNQKVINVFSKAMKKNEDIKESLKDYDNDEINESIELKSFSHFEEIIFDVYQQKTNRSHLIMDVMLKKEGHHHQTTSNITFVEFGSSFYKSNFRQGEELQMENDIESTIHILQNLPRIKNPAQYMFKSSLITKVLKENFLQSIFFNLIGMLDDSYKSNFKTLNYLDMALQKKHSHTLIKNVQEQIKREEVILNSLYEKHRKALNLLSRCIGMQLGFLQKNKKNKNFDGPILNSFNKKCEKIKFANIKKLQNENIQEKIENQLKQEEREIEDIKAEYTKKLELVSQKKKELLNDKKIIEEKYDKIVNPPIQFTNTVSNHFWKPEFDEINVHPKYQIQDEIYGSLLNESDWDEFKSYKVPSATTIQPTTKTIYPKQQKRPRVKERYERSEKDEKLYYEERRQNELKSQIGRLFMMISEQQNIIDEGQKQIAGHHTILLNKIKNRKSSTMINIDTVKECLKVSEDRRICGKNYRNFKKNVQVHENFQKEVLQRVSNQGVTVKSLKTMKSLQSVRVD